MIANWVSIICRNYTYEVTGVCDNRTGQHEEIMITMLDLNIDSCTLNFVGDFNAIFLFELKNLFEKIEIFEKNAI